MKARPIDGLDPDGPLVAAARLIVRVRTDELCDLVTPALDPSAAAAQHDLRIAAKRLRYLLELTEFCFGPYAAVARGHAKHLQTLLGDVHDCDVLLARMHGTAAPDPGIQQLIDRYTARRVVAYDAFRHAWTAIEGEAFRNRLLAALDEPPAGRPNLSV